jgi:hypothetical protein
MMRRPILLEAVDSTWAVSTGQLGNLRFQSLLSTLQARIVIFEATPDFAGRLIRVWMEPCESSEDVEAWSLQCSLVAAQGVDEQGRFAAKKPFRLMVLMQDGINTSAAAEVEA